MEENAHVNTNDKHIAKEKSHIHPQTHDMLTLFFIMENNCEIVKVFKFSNFTAFIFVHELVLS